MSIPIFVINLKRSPERRAFMEKQLQELGLSSEFLVATDGRELTSTKVEELYDQTASLKYLKQPLSTNEVACADSHLRIYEEIIKRNLPYALILEDDGLLDSRIKDVLHDKFLKSSDFDWLQIGYSSGWHFFTTWWQSSWLQISRRPLFFAYFLAKLPYIFPLSLYEELRNRLDQNQPQIRIFARPLYLTNAYIVTKAGAEKLVACGRPIRFAADMLPNKARLQSPHFKMRGLVPSLVKPSHSFPSDIWSKPN